MALELRPTFIVELPEACAVVEARLHAGLRAQPLAVNWARVPGARREKSQAGTSLQIALPHDQRRFWSPWLHLDVIPNDAGTRLFGQFSPKPSVWTAFALSYLALACVMFFSAIVGVSQLMLKQAPWILWITLASGAMIVLLWWASQTGQRLARAQMQTLRSAIDFALSHEE